MKKFRTLFALVLALAMVLAMPMTASAADKAIPSIGTPVIEARTGQPTDSDVALTKDTIGMVSAEYRSIINRDASVTAPIAPKAAAGVQALAAYDRISFYSVTSYPLYVDNSDGSLYYYNGEREYKYLNGVIRPLVKRARYDHLYVDFISLSISGYPSSTSWSYSGYCASFKNYGSSLTCIGWDYNVRVDYRTGSIYTYDDLVLRY